MQGWKNSRARGGQLTCSSWVVTWGGRDEEGGGIEGLERPEVGLGARLGTAGCAGAAPAAHVHMRTGVCAHAQVWKQLCRRACTLQA